MRSEKEIKKQIKRFETRLEYITPRHNLWHELNARIALLKWVLGE